MTLILGKMVSILYENIYSFINIYKQRKMGVEAINITYLNKIRKENRERQLAWCLYNP